jgi:hypothetical protein
MRSLWAGPGTALLTLTLGGCTLNLIDDAISNEMQVSFLGADRLEIRAEGSRSQADVFAAADKACGAPASPVNREERPGDEGRFYTMTFRCERPAQAPPRDATPLPPVLRQPRH